MINNDTKEKFSKGFKFFLQHALMYLGASALYFIVAIRIVVSVFSFATINSLISSIMNFALVGFGYIVFSVFYFFLVRSFYKFKDTLKIQEEQNRKVEGSKVTQKEYTQFMTYCNRQEKTLEELIVKIKDRAVKFKIEDILTTVKKIHSIFVDEPSEIKQGKLFIEHYLPAAVKIVGKYITYQKHVEESESARKSLEEIEGSLDVIHTGFKKQLDKLLENGIMDVDVELKVLRTTLKSEGLE
jgi:5-bromo-4-chloroindolyl phosphate hydrolysis protein